MKGHLSRALSFVALSALTACAVLVDFNRYDIDGQQAPEASVAPAPVDFDLDMPDAVRVEPGTSVTLTVSVRRHDDRAGAIAISVADPLPEGLDAVKGATIAPGETTALLTLTARPGAPAGDRPLHIVGLADDVRRAKETRLSFRGLTCTPDLGFGAGRGLITIDLQVVGAPRGLGIATGADQIVFGAGSGRNDVIESVDQAGNVRWQHSDDLEPPLLSLALEPVGTVLVVGAKQIVRLDGAGRPIPFGGPGANGLDCDGTIIAQPPPRLSLVCRLKQTWWLHQKSSDGAFRSSSGFNLTPFTNLDDGTPAATLSNAGIVACGTTTNKPETFGTILRFAPVGTVDRTFGDGGRVMLGEGTSLTGCVADDRGIVSIGKTADDVQGALFGVTGSGTLDTSFGDAGTKVGPFVLTAIALERGNLLAGGDGEDGAHLLRMLRDGRPDRTFASSGDCPLAGMKSVLSILVTSDAKVLVLGVSADTADTIVLARLWL